MQQKPKREVDEKQVVREGANSLITYPNASAFSVFSHICHFVLQNELCDTFNSCVCPGHGDSLESEEEETTKKEDSRKLPVVVGLGVKGVSFIIRDIRQTHSWLVLNMGNSWESMIHDG